MYIEVKKQKKGCDDVTEREIIDLIRSRNQDGLSELLKHYRPMMSYIITPILSSPEDLEECVSEVTLKVWDNILNYDENKSSFKTWLTAITRNTALNHLRKNQKHTQVDLDLENYKAKEGNPEEIILKKEKQEQLKKVLNNLDSKERTLFYRKYYYMQSTAQIAREMGTTERAVEGKLYRIKNTIRKQMGGWENE